MKVLVTGATGFLGRWLCKALVNKGYHVHALVRSSSDTRYLKTLPVILHIGDVRDLPSFMQAGSGMEIIFHLAGLVAYAKQFHSEMQKVNVEGTAHAIEVCRQNKARLIYMSSVVAVGASSTPCVLNENSPYNMARFQMGYFDSKKQAEELVLSACQRGQISAVILNPSTVYGAGDMTKQSRRTQIRVAKGKFPFYTEGGVSIVDVESVIQAVIQAVDNGRSGERYILSGDNISIKELFQMIAMASGVRPPFIKLNNWVLDVLAMTADGLQIIKIPFILNSKDMRLGRLYHWFDHSKAREELDFVPQNAQIAINNSINWWKKQRTSANV